MGFILLWLESLAAAVLLTTAGVTIAARRRSCWPVMFAVLPALAAVAYIAFTAGTIERNRTAGFIVDAVRYGALAWATVLTVGTLIVVAVGMRRIGELPQRQAQDWSALRLALAGVAGVVLFVATLWTMTNALMPQIAALRAEAGTFALSATPPALPDHENAAPLYEAAAEWFTISADEQASLDRWLAADTLDPNDREPRAFLARRAAGLDLIGRATARAGCHFDSSPSHPVGATDATGHVRRALMVVALRARVYASVGRKNEAIQYIDQMMRMSGHVAANSNVSAALTAAAMESQALATLDKILIHGAPLAKDRGASLVDDPIFYRYRLRRALQTEEALVYGRLAGIAEQATGFGLLLLDDELAAYHAVFRRMAEELAKPYPECLRGWAGLEEEFADIPGNLYRLSIQAYIRLLPAIARADASRRVARLAVVAARYQATEGKFPARAEDLVPAYMSQVPLDPFSGQPLKFKATADGIVIYSVGPDGVDDGGQPLTDDRPPKGDIRVRIGERK